MLTQNSASFVTGFDQNRFPPAALENARKSILDFLGVALAGRREPAAEAVSSYAASCAGLPRASVIGRGVRTSAALAALANGTIGHCLDYDDYSLESGTHPTVAVLPAVLALAEENRACGSDALAAYIVGVEVLSKIANGLWRAQYGLGWHCTSTFGCIGAAAASSRLLRLTAEQTASALGIAASMAGGLRQNFGTSTKPFHAGMAARNGVEAALLAAGGMKAASDSLEGEFGFVKVFSGGKEAGVPGVRFGDPLSVASPGLALKFYPSCGTTHCGIDAALRLRERHHPALEDIDSIVIEAHPMVPEVVRYHHPRTGMEAKFSMEYCIARALAEGKVELTHFEAAKVSEPGVRRTVEKASFFIPDDERKKEYNWATGLRLTMKDGTEFHERVEAPRGDPSRPLSWDEVCTKFRDCVSSGLSQSQAEEVVGLVSRLESLDSVSRLMEIMSACRQ